MKKLMLLLLCFVLSAAHQSIAQENNADYFNGFQRTNDNNPDSAMYFLRKLAVENPSLMEDLLHNSFAQNFMPFIEIYANDSSYLKMLKERNMTLDSVSKMFKKKQIVSGNILRKINNDENLLIKQNGYQITQWIDAKNNSTDAKKLLKIGSDYLQYLSKQSNLFEGRKGRYGLLIYNIMAKHAQLKTTSDKLFTFIYDNLKDHQILSNPDEASWTEREMRTWYRYLFAYTNFIAAQNDKNGKLNYLKIAATYSPDAVDRQIKSAYFYDMMFLFNKEKDSFEEDYLSALENNSDKFKMLMEMSFKDPSFKAKAKALYKDPSSFNEYWLSEFNKNHQIAPEFSLVQTDGREYTLKNSKDQWTLIDFWGTWCNPCRKEHPDLQKLYLQTKEGKMAKLAIFTIASHDQEPKVKDYMEKLNYGFPVAMSDNEIEKKYKVDSWPSKFLVSPQGKYVAIPFGINWQKYIEQYIN